jgi:hypothetical protein
MKFRLVSLVFLCAIFLCAADHTFACLCPYRALPLKDAVKEAHKNAVAVFTAEIVSVGDYVEGKREVTFRVVKNWKGAPATEIKMMLGGMGCDYFFEVGKSYLIYAKDESGTLTVNICSRTALFDGRKLRKEIKALEGLERADRSLRAGT